MDNNSFSNLKIKILEIHIINDGSQGAISFNGSLTKFECFPPNLKRSFKNSVSVS